MTINRRRQGENREARQGTPGGTWCSGAKAARLGEFSTSNPASAIVVQARTEVDELSEKLGSRGSGADIQVDGRKSSVILYEALP